MGERLWILEEQHGVLYAKIDLCDRGVINSEESQMTSEQFRSKKQKMSYGIDSFLSLNPHSCKCRLINIGQAGALQFVPHLNPKGRQLGKGKRNGVSWKKNKTAWTPQGHPAYAGLGFRVALRGERVGTGGAGRCQPMPLLNHISQPTRDNLFLAL